MSVLGIGVDLVENARIQHSLERFGGKSGSHEAMKREAEFAIPGFLVSRFIFGFRS
jgi:phosphopantetheinyl transferase (holo-ACP synthase)